MFKLLESTFVLLLSLLFMFIGIATTSLWPKNLSKILSLSKGGSAEMYKKCQSWSKSDKLNKMLSELEEGQIPIGHVLTMLTIGKKVNYSTVLAELQSTMYKMKLRKNKHAISNILPPSEFGGLQFCHEKMMNKTLECASSVHKCTKEDCNGVDQQDWTDLDMVYEQILLALCAKPW